MWNEQAGYAPAADMGFRLGRDDQQPMFGGGFDQTGRRQRLRAMMMMPRDQAMAMMGGGQQGPMDPMSKLRALLGGFGGQPGAPSPMDAGGAGAPRPRAPNRLNLPVMNTLSSHSVLGGVVR